MAVRRRSQGEAPVMAGGGAFQMAPDSPSIEERREAAVARREESPFQVSTTPSIAMPQIPDPPVPVPPPDGGDQGAGGGKGEGPREGHKPTGGAGTGSLSNAPSIPTPNITGGGQTGVRRREDAAPQATSQIPPPAPMAAARRREPRLFGESSTGMPLFGKAGGLLGGGLGVPGAVSGGETPDPSALIQALLRQMGRG